MFHAMQLFVQFKMMWTAKPSYLKGLRVVGMVHLGIRAATDLARFLGDQPTF